MKRKYNWTQNKNWELEGVGHLWTSNGTLWWAVMHGDLHDMEGVVGAYNSQQEAMRAIEQEWEDYQDATQEQPHPEDFNQASHP
jgi:hypothetical protein